MQISCNRYQMEIQNLYHEGFIASHTNYTELTEMFNFLLPRAHIEIYSVMSEKMGSAFFVSLVLPDILKLLCEWNGPCYPFSHFSWTT